MLENIQVFSVNNQRAVETQSPDSSKINSKTVSLLVTPDQNSVLMMAKSQGTLSLALRNSEDNALSKAIKMKQNLTVWVRARGSSR